MFQRRVVLQVQKCIILGVLWKLSKYMPVLLQKCRSLVFAELITFDKL